SLEEIISGMIAIISFRPGGRMQQSAVLRCAILDRKHGRHRAMKRRDFITLVGGAAAWPHAARAQQTAKVWRIGMLETISSPRNSPQLDAFRQRLQQLGYVEGQNLLIEYRSAEGRNDRFPSLAAELIERNVDLIVLRETPAAIAAKNATSTIPLVATALGDPLLVVASLARPGGNLTGLSSFTRTYLKIA